MKSSALGKAAPAKAEAAAKSPQPPAESVLPIVNPVWQLLALGAQPRLAVGAADSPAECEADRVAERVLQMPQPQLQRQCAACATGPAPCPTCSEEQPVQRKAVPAAAPPSRVGQFSGSGAPLGRESRAFFEPRFGADFSRVRVHTGPAASASAAALGARAFTLGSDIAFAAGEYQPSSSAGLGLLAHELTHVLQQLGPTDPHASRADSTDAGVAVQQHDAAPTIRRACVAGLIPELRCCIPGLSARRIGTIAHQQLQVGAALVAPGTIGEVAIPPTPRVLPPPSRGWRFADLYASSPAMPIKAPSRAGLPPFLGRFHPEINPLGWPVASVPPAGPASSAGLGEIKPLSVHGLTAGPADLARNILQYDLWSMTASGGPISMVPIIPGGMLGSPLNFLFGVQTGPGLYHYCCLDARRIARAVARALRRAWEVVKELWRRFIEFLEEYWEIIVIILLVIIAIILIIVFWEAIVAAIAAIGAGILRLLAWLLRLIIGGPGRVPVPVRPPPIPIEPPPIPIRPPSIPIEPPIPIRPPVPVQPPAPPMAAAAAVLLSLRGLVSSYQQSESPPPVGTDSEEETDPAPELEGSTDATVDPNLPFAAPPEVDAAAAGVAAGVEAVILGALDGLSAYVADMPSMPNQSTGLGEALLAGAPAMLGPLLLHMHGSDLHDEARQMILQFLARAQSTRPGSGEPAA